MSRRDVLQLFQVVQIVAGHRVDDCLDGHVAALRMIRGFGELLRCERLNKLNVPVADRAESRERRVDIVGVVMLREPVLVEGLHDVPIFSHGLPQPEREDNFAIGEVADDLSRAPFPRRKRLVDALSAKLSRDIVELFSGRRDYFNRIAIAKVRSVRVHAENGTTISLFDSSLSSLFALFRLV